MAISWNEFVAREAEMADAGRQLLYQFGGVGLGFLATIRPDGGPRVHPLCPILTETGLFANVIPSPKRRDLERDGRIAVHSFPTDSNEDAFYVTGVARKVEDKGVRKAVRDQFLAERAHLNLPPDAPADDEPFEFLLETALLTRTTGFGDVNPQHTIWRLTGERT